MSDLDGEKDLLVRLGAEIMAAPEATPNGRRLIARHPDGAVFEYVEVTDDGSRSGTGLLTSGISNWEWMGCEYVVSPCLQGWRGLTSVVDEADRRMYGRLLEVVYVDCRAVAHGGGFGEQRYAEAGCDEPADGGGVGGFELDVGLKALVDGGCNQDRVQSRSLLERNRKTSRKMFPGAGLTTAVITSPDSIETDASELLAWSIFTRRVWVPGSRVKSFR